MGAAYWVAIGVLRCQGRESGALGLALGFVGAVLVVNFGYVVVMTAVLKQNSSFR